MSRIYEKKLRLRRCFSAVFIILFLNWFGHSAVQANKPMDFLQPGKLVLFIVKFESLMCSPCLNPILDFYHLLPFPLRENMVWGIIVYDNPDEKGKREVYRRIVEKKSRGFFKANNIACPIVFDHSHSFKKFFKKGTAILLFDREKKVLRTHIFPLSQKQKKEILNFLRIK